MFDGVATITGNWSIGGQSDKFMIQAEMYSMQMPSMSMGMPMMQQPMM